MGTSFSNLWRNATQAPGNPGNHKSPGKLGDFTTSPRVILISCMAILIGMVSAFVALILLRLIGLVTNLFYFQRWDTALAPTGAYR